MRKIWDKSVFDYNKKTKRYELNEKESIFHYIDDDAPIALMKGGGNREIASKTEVPWQNKYLDFGLNEAQKSFLDSPGQSVAEFTPDTLEAQQMIRQRARNGSPLNATNAGLLNDTMQGNYLYGGKGFDEALGAASRKINPLVDSTFERSGRGGSGLSDVAKTQAMSDSFANLYNQERGRQMQASELAPGAANQDYVDAGMLGEVGTQEQAQQQARLDARRNLIAQFFGLAKGDMGNTTTSYEHMKGGRGWLDYLLKAGGGAAKGYESGGWPGAAAGATSGTIDAYQQNHPY